MTRTDLILAILAAAEGRPYTPVQLQKATFLVTRNVPGIVDGEAGFQFVPYDYGPFDASVYATADRLATAGEAIVAPSGFGRWNTYAASDRGIEHGRAILDELNPKVSSYIRSVSAWVRSLSFSSLVKSIYEAYPEMRANSIFRD